MRSYSYPFDFSKFGCRVNALSVEDLFGAYEAAGFIYRAKRAVLEPYYSIVTANWRAALDARLLYVFSYGNVDDPPWASVTSWMHTTRGWNTQHLVGIGGPIASRAVMLSKQAADIEDTDHNSHQSFFQRKNRFANRVFGTVVESLSPNSCFVLDYAYLSIPKTNIASFAPDATVSELRSEGVAELQVFLDSQRSVTFRDAEEFNAEAINLDSLNQQYRSAGLFRFRRLNVLRHRGRIVACAVAYRGPLGLNFSFLENRCELIIDRNMSKAAALHAAAALLKESSIYYDSFEPDCMYILTDVQNQSLLEELGASFLRLYTQSLWNRTGYKDWYGHVDRVYKPVMRRVYDRRSDDTESTNAP